MRREFVEIGSTKGEICDRIGVMNTEILTQAGLSELQAKVYLCLIKHGQQTPSEVAREIDENRTTVYSAMERLEKLGIITQKDKGKISAYIPNHPSVLERLAERRLRSVARQAKNLESNLPSLINYYNEHQNEPGAATFYGEEGVKMIWDKVIAAKQPYYFVRSRYDEGANLEGLGEFKKARVEAGIEAQNITPSEFATLNNKKAREWYVYADRIAGNCGCDATIFLICEKIYSKSN